MKKYIITIGCALCAQVINTFAGPTFTSWEESYREDLQERREAAAYNESEWLRHRR
jgi:hypothetical protein